jgi:hypothetical protein
VTPQPIARPVDEPHAALVATCECGLRIVRLNWSSARWRHDGDLITCTPPAPPEGPPAESPDELTFDHLVRGKP